MLTLDYETSLIRPGMQSPPIACAIVSGDGWPTALYAQDDIIDATRRALAHGVCGVNIAYDMACAYNWLPLQDEIIAAYEADRVIDLGAIERILEIEGHVPKRYSHSLESLCGFYGIACPPKDDGVRLDFGRYVGRPLSEFTQRHVDYAMGDGHAGIGVYREQSKIGFSQRDAAMLSRDMFWLRCASNYGVRCDTERTKKLEVAATQRLAELKEIAQEIQLLPARSAVKGETKYVNGKRGLVPRKAVVDEHLPAQRTYQREDFATERQYEKALDTLRPVRLNGKGNKRHLQALVNQAYHGDPPQTKRSKTASPNWEPQIATSKHVLADSGDPLLSSLAEYGEWAAIVNKDLDILRRGSTEPIHTRFGLANSTRTTSSGPNVQNFRSSKIGKIGIRECFVPRPGYCYVGADWSMLEIRTVAQVIVRNLQSWHLADQVNNGVDIHTQTGQAIAQLLGAEYDEEVHRKLAKVPNFGCLGGMSSPKSLRAYARGMGLKLAISTVRTMLNAWRQAQPDGPLYLNWIRNRYDNGRGAFDVQIPGCGITRRGAPYTAAANTPFQGLAARIAGVTGWDILKATVTPGDDLFGCRMVLFIHDEYILECPLGQQTEAAARLVDIMCKSGQHLVPDIKLEAKRFCSAYWSKDAEALYQEGELQIWSQE